MTSPLHLFQGFGVELEYMIVDAETLDVLPISDRILEGKCGEITSELEDGEIAWSNELVLHVLELKTNGPAPDLSPLPEAFADRVREANRIASRMGARLMPTAMHPWMDPLRETQLWPHEYSPVYEAFDRIFGCSGHGWSNLQSTHINLPFANDDEFGRLHAAIRAILPLLPALAASSPIVEGNATGTTDNRLSYYRRNARRIPSVSGDVIPEPVYTRNAYETELLGRLYKDIAPHDPDRILQYEWLNARGAIARFDRMAIEIRVLDIQECPSADLAVVALVSAAVKALANEKWISERELSELPTELLAKHFILATQSANDCIVESPEWLAAFGLKQPTSTREVWSHLLSELTTHDPNDPLAASSSIYTVAQRLLSEGCLSDRILRRLKDDNAGAGSSSGSGSGAGSGSGSGSGSGAGSFTKESVREVYRELCACLDEDRMFS